MSEQKKRKFDPKDGEIWEVMKGPLFTVPDHPPKYVWLPRPRHHRRPGGPTHWRVRVADLLPSPPPRPPKRGPLPPIKDEGKE
jgi:hypothetical protein